MSNNVVAMTIRDLVKTVKDHPVKVLEWLGYNVFIGTMAIWLTWLFYYLASKQFDMAANIKRGELLIFVTTLCASSMGIFAEIREPHFRSTKRVTLLIVTIIVIISSAIGSFVGLPEAKTFFSVNENRVVKLSVLMFIIGVLASLFLYSMRLSLETYDFGKEQQEGLKELSDASKSRNETKDGARL